MVVLSPGRTRHIIAADEMAETGERREIKDASASGDHK
jgi:hypothetical protein